MLCKYFLPMCDCLFTLNSFFEDFNFDEVQFFLLWVVLLVLHLRNAWLNPLSQRFSPVFSLRYFNVSDFIFRSIIHFELIFVNEPKYGSKVFLCYFCVWISIISSSFVEKTNLSLLNCLCTFVKNRLSIYE